MDDQGSSVTTQVTLGELLRDSALELQTIVVPDGSLERPVSWVHATEQLDPRPHLRRHELVCTLGSALVRSLAPERFVEALVEGGAAGVVLGIGEVHLEPPSELVRACERWGLPLLLQPHGVPFLAVNDAVIRRRAEIEDEARGQETVLLSRLMAMARSGSTGEELLRSASSELGGELRAVDGPGHVPAWTGDGHPPSAVFMDQLGSLLEFATLEHDREASERQLQIGQLVELVLNGLAHPAAILPELQSHGLDAQGLRVSNWPTGSEEAVASRWPEAMIGTTTNSVYVFTRALAAEGFRELGLVCGYSEVVALPDLRRALNEATSALRLARSRGGVAGPEMLVTLDALLEQQPSERLMPFIEHLISPIMDADRNGRGNLMDTLVSFLALEGQLRASSVKLGVHVNTVRHRLARIHELTGRDPLTLEGSADLRIGLWAAERRRVIRHRLIRPLQ